MRRILAGMIAVSVFTPMMAWAQQAPQLTNEDLLKLIGLKEIQALQCGKALEAAQQQIVALTPKSESPKKDAK